MNQNNQRNHGIDILKILAMFMITILHTEGHGGILFSGKLIFNQDNFFYSHYSVAWFLEILCYGAVDCYAMISGYVNWKNSVRYHKLVLLWVQVVFYTISITLIYSFLDGSESNWFNAFFPILTHQYWYITAYVGVFLLMPVLNKYLQNTDNKVLYLHLILIFIVMSILPIFIGKGDPFILNAGYSTLWLAIMYLFGAAISKLKENKINQYKLLAWFIIIITITWGYKIGIDYFNIYHKFSLNYPNLVDYRSPTVVLSSIVLVLLCSQLNINNKYLKKLIVLVSNATLGIYLIHDNGLVRSNLISNYASEFIYQSQLGMIGSIIVGAATIFVICCFIEIIRENIFSLLGINSFIRKISWSSLNDYTTRSV